MTSIDTQGTNARMQKKNRLLSCLLWLERPVSPRMAATLLLCIAVFGGVFGGAYSIRLLSNRSVGAGSLGGGTAFAAIGGLGFDLSHCVVDENQILSGGPGKDGIPALTDPKTVPVDRADYLSADDRVIGVSLEGESRAYPLSVLVWHEVVNDTVGGTPIAVTYCPLCDSSLVFHRNVGGQTREFGVSGLLYQSNVLMYDRQRRTSSESLWSQAAMKAVCGPAARDGLTLELLDSTLSTFTDWAESHPEGTVISMNTGYSRPYRQKAYADYFATDQLMFPVAARTNRRPDLRNKDQVLVLTVAGQKRAYAFKDLAGDPDGIIEDDLAGNRVRLVYDPDSGKVDLQGPQQGDANHAPIHRAYMFWFAYDAFYPEGEVYSPLDNAESGGLPGAN